MSGLGLALEIERARELRTQMEQERAARSRANARLDRAYQETMARLTRLRAEAQAREAALAEIQQG